MKKIKLNEDAGKITSNDEYILDPTEEYVIDIEKEMDFQMATMMSMTSNERPIMKMMRIG